MDKRARTFVVSWSRNSNSVLQLSAKSIYSRSLKQYIILSWTILILLLLNVFYLWFLQEFFEEECRNADGGRWVIAESRHWWCQKLCCFTDFTRNTITFRCGPWKTDYIDVDPNWIKPNLILEHRMNKIYCYWSKYVHCIYWEWIPYIHYFTLVF